MYKKFNKIEKFLTTWSITFTLTFYISVLTIIPIFNLIIATDQCEMKPNEWYTPFYIKTPFIDRNTLFGYFLYYLFEICIYVICFILLFNNMLLFISPTIYLEVLNIDYCQIYDEIDKMLSKQINIGNIEKKLIETVEFYIDIVR